MSIIQSRRPLPLRQGHRVVTPQMFGAHGDGSSDDTASLQAMFDYIGANDTVVVESWNSTPGGTSSSLLEAELGSYRYATGPLTIPLYCRIHGDNAALVFTGTTSQDVLTGTGAYQFTVVGVNFVGGRHAIHLDNANIDRTRWHITGCEFRAQSSFAINTAATGGTYNHLSAVLTIKECLFDRAAQVLNNCCDTAIVEDCWVYVDAINAIPSAGIFKNRGDDGNLAHDVGNPRLILRNMFGVPTLGVFNAVAVTITIASPAVVTWTSHGLVAGDVVVFTTTGALPTGITASTAYYVISAGLATDSFEFSATRGGTAVITTGSQSGVQSANARVLNIRWIDNYTGQIICEGCRFGGEQAGIPIVLQVGAPITTTPFIPATMVCITDSWIYCGTSTDPQSGVVSLGSSEIPNVIVIRNCNGPGTGRYISNPASLNIATYMATWEGASSQSAVDYFYVDIEAISDVSGVTVIPTGLLPYLINRNVGKCWLYATISGGVPTLEASYNITSISDDGVGLLGVTIRTDFPDAVWAAFVSGKTDSSAADTISYTSKAAGTITIVALDSAGTHQDPISYDFMGMGYGGGMSHGH